MRKRWQRFWMTAKDLKLLGRFPLSPDGLITVTDVEQ